MKKIKRKNIVIVIAIVLFLAAGLVVINKESYAEVILCPQGAYIDIEEGERAYLSENKQKITLASSYNWKYVKSQGAVYFPTASNVFKKTIKENNIIYNNYTQKIISSYKSSVLIGYLLNDTTFSQNKDEETYYKQLLLLWAMDRLRGFEDSNNYIKIYGEDGYQTSDIDYSYKNKYNIDCNDIDGCEYTWVYTNNLSAGDKLLLKNSKYGDKILSYLDTWEDYVAWYLDGQNVELDSITQDDISYYVTNDYVETKLITPKSTGKVYSDKFASYTVEVSSPMTVLDSNGNEKKEFKAGDGFKVRIPVSKINDKTLNYSIKVVGNFDFPASNIYEDSTPNRAFFPDDDRDALYYKLAQYTIYLDNCSTTKTLKDDIELNFTQKVGELNIKVIDTSTGNNLSKATVQIEDAKGNIVYRYETTEKDFNVTLPTGNYLVKQTVTPPNYEAITIQMRVSVEENGESSVVLENAPLVNVPDTNMTSYMPLIGFITLIFGILILGIIIRTKKYEQDF